MVVRFWVRMADAIDVFRMKQEYFVRQTGWTANLKTKLVHC